MKRYVSPLTKEITADNWKDKINLKQLSLDDITDLLGDFKEMESLAKKLSGFLREAAIARMPEDENEYASSNFGFIINERTRAGGLNKPLIEEEMGEEWVVDHSLPPTDYLELRISRIQEAA